MSDAVYRHPMWIRGAMAESRRLELQFADQVERAFQGLAGASAGLRKLFGGVRPELDRKLDELDAILGTVRVTIDTAKLDQENFATHHQMLLEVFAELECAIRRLFSKTSVEQPVHPLRH